MSRSDIELAYRKWLDRFTGRASNTMSKLLDELYSREFIWTIPRDENRAKDGLHLRRRFANENGYSLNDINILDRPCTLLEMIISVAIRIEDQMEDGDNRTSHWFSVMIDNLGLGNMSNRNYDDGYVDYVIERFNNRAYEPDGDGSLFYVPTEKRDMRDIEIWYQMCSYLNTL